MADPTLEKREGSEGSAREWAGSVAVTRSPDGAAEPRGLAILALLVLLSIPTLFWRLGDRQVHDVVEARVAVTAREMARKDEWVVPTMHGRLRLQKPPLAYWLPECAAVLRGTFDEWTLRAPFALLGVGTLVLVYALGTILGGSALGAIAALFLLTSPLFLKEARCAAADVPLLFAAAGAWCFYAAALKEAGSSGRTWPRVAFYAMLAVGALAKGPVILLLALLPVLAHGALTRSLRPLRPLWSPAGIGLFLILSLAWPLLVAAHAGPGVVRQWFLESFGKVLPTDGVEAGYRYQKHSEPWHFYFLRLPAIFGPWIALLVLGLIPWRRRTAGGVPAPHSGRDLKMLPFLWFGAVLVAFSLVEEKKLTYALAFLVPGALLAAQGWIAWYPRLRPVLRLLALTLGLLAPVGTIAALALTEWPRSSLLLGGLIATLGSVLFLRALMPAASLRAAVVLTTMVAVLAAPYHDVRLTLIPGDERPREAALELASHLDRGKALHAAGNLPLEFLYYVDAELDFVEVEVDGQRRIDEQRLAALPPGARILVTHRVLEPFMAAPLPVGEGAPRGVEGQAMLKGPLAGCRFVKVIRAEAKRVKDRMYLLARDGQAGG